MIPFLDLKAPYLELKKELDDAYSRVMETGWFIRGQEVEAFESEFAQYTGTKHCVGVGNGLDAIELLLKAHNIGEGDEVIVPSNTFIATWLAVSHVGAIPVPVEPDPETFNINPELIEKRITKKTKAIIAVHLYGQCADVDPIINIAKKYGLLVFEDAAQAHGAYYKGRRAGTLADGAAFSFYPGKNLGAFGDAGAITVNDSSIADKVKMLSNYGSKVKYHNEVQGFNTRLDEMQAAFLRVKLRKLSEWNQRRSIIASIYEEGLRANTRISLPCVPQHATPVWHLYVIRVKNRDIIKDTLYKNGVETIIHYPIPPHQSNAYKSYNQESFQIANELASTVLSLPIGPHLKMEQVSIVVELLNKIII